MRPAAGIAAIGIGIGIGIGIVGALASGCARPEASPAAPETFVDRVPAANGSVKPGDLAHLRESGYLASHVTLGGETRPSLAPALPSHLSFAVEIGDRTRLRFAIAASGLSGDEGALFRVTVKSADERHRVFEERLPAARQSRFWDRLVDLSAFREESVELTFETELVGRRGEEDRAEAWWGGPVLYAAEDGKGAANANVILVSIDCLRADHVGVYGYPAPTTPSLDRFAQDAVVFRRALSASSWTIPSHVSMFTGLPPMLHGVNDTPDSFWAGRARKLSTSVPYLAEILSHHGYETAGVVSSVPVSTAYGFERGFSLYRLHAARADYVVDSALELLRRGRDRKQLLFLHFIDAHWPYLPMVDYRSYAEEFIDRFGPRPGDVSSLLHRLSGKGLNARVEDAPAARTLYDAAIAHIDRELGRLFRSLRRLGLYDASLIIVTGDHGEAFGEHGTWTHGNSLYQELTHVPLLVKWPGEKLSGEVETPVSHVDLFPTILRAAGIDPPGNEGRDLRPIVEAAGGNAISARSLVADASYEDRSRRETMISVRMADRKYVAVFPYAPLDELSLEKRIREELYDLARDPGETRNLSRESGVDLAPFRERVRDYVEAARSYRNRQSGAEALDLDEDTRRELESLGYVNR
jgi:arylsulfatase A-like enzyme